jgi:hypothetical protein
MKGEYYVWEKSENFPKGSVVKIFTSLKSVANILKTER